MSNYSNNMNLFVFTFSKHEINERALIEVFDMDNDFSDNEDYFREDTKSLGFNNESERCADEVYKKFRSVKDPHERLAHMVDEMVGYNNGVQTFIVGHQNWSGDYETRIEPVGDTLVLAIGYIG